MPITHSQKRSNRGEIDLRIRSDSFDEDARTFEAVFSTGAKVRRYDWWRERYYDEELSIDPAHIRLDRMNGGGAPFALDHRTYSVDSVVGSIVEGSVEVRNGELVGLISLHETEKGTEIMGRMARKELRNVSVGYRTHEQQLVRAEEENQVDTRTAIDWEPFELSLVAVGADAGSQVREMGDEPMCLLRDHNGEPMPVKTPAGKKGAAPAANPTPGDSNRSGGESAAGTPATPEPAPQSASTGADEQARAAELAEAERRGGAAEADRRDQIRAAVASAGLDAAFAETLIKDETGIDAARALIIDKIAETRGGDEVNSQARTQVGEDEQEKYYDAVERALLAKHDSRQFPVKDGDDARQLRGYSLMELGTKVLLRSGASDDLPGDPDMRAKLIMGARVGRRSMHTSSDFPGILANVAEKTLRRGYDTARKVHGPLIRERNASNFKELTSNQLGAASMVKEVAEGAEYTHGTIGEAKEVYRVKKYGNIIPLTWEMVINDDLDALTRIPGKMGAQCARNENIVFWSIFRDNPTMGDGLPLFHADHGNIITGPLDLVGLNAGMVAMGLQTDLDGETELDIMPEFVMTPISLKTQADQLLVQTTVPTTDADTNTFKGELTPISTQYLDKASTFEWYMAAGSAAVDTIEVAYLGGNKEPVFDYREGFDVDGTEIKVRHVFGMKAIDWRGLVKSTGV